LTDDLERAARALMDRSGPPPYAGELVRVRLSPECRDIRSPDGEVGPPECFPCLECGATAVYRYVTRVKWPGTEILLCRDHSPPDGLGQWFEPRHSPPQWDGAYGFVSDRYVEVEADTHPYRVVCSFSRDATLIGEGMWFSAWELVEPTDAERAELVRRSFAELRLDPSRAR
jgi:hypothetical protein